MGWPDQFIEHGKVDCLRKKYGLTVADAYAPGVAAAFAPPAADAGGELNPAVNSVRIPACDNALTTIASMRLTEFSC